MELTFWSAAWFLPFVTPICLYVAWSDMKLMRIPNPAVLSLLGVFIVVGFIALPFDAYLWRYLHFLVVLAIGVTFNSAGLVGAGDAKFAAAAAPFIALGDLFQLAMILAATVLVAWATHRIAKHTGLRKLAPDWQSWAEKKDFPMGMALGPALVIYLGFGLL